MLTGQVALRPPKNRFESWMCFAGVVFGWLVCQVWIITMAVQGWQDVVQLFQQGLVVDQIAAGITLLLVVGVIPLIFAYLVLMSYRDAVNFGCEPEG